MVVGSVYLTCGKACVQPTTIEQDASSVGLLILNSHKIYLLYLVDIISSIPTV